MTLLIRWPTNSPLWAFGYHRIESAVVVNAEALSLWELIEILRDRFRPYPDESLADLTVEVLA